MNGDPSEGAIPVVGTARCSFRLVSRDTGDGSVRIEQEFTCDVDMSDPRVSGTESLPIVTVLVGTDGIWAVEGAVLSTEEGRWTGSGRGVATAADIWPGERLGEYLNIGEMHYVGEGAYEGLQYHYTAGSDKALAISGWIEETPRE